MSENSDSSSNSSSSDIDKKRDYNRQYYEKNKNRLKEEYTKKKTCICGATVSKASYTRHLNTTKHEKRLYNRFLNSRDGGESIINEIDNIIKKAITKINKTMEDSIVKN